MASPFGFVLPPTSLPLDVIQKQMSILAPAGVDAQFLNTVFPISNASGLFTNPFAGAMSQLDGLTSQFNSLVGVADAVGLGSVVSTMSGYMTDMSKMLTNVGTNIVPMNLPVPGPISDGLASAASSVAGIASQDQPVLGSFLQSLGSPSLGTIMNVGLSQYSLNQLRGTVDPTNPLPLMTQYSQHLTDLSNGCTSMIAQATSVASGIAGASIDNLPGVITGGLSSIESTMGSAMAGPMATFGGGMFTTIKDQMTSGLAISMRHMVETNFGMKYMLTGQDTTGGGGYTGLLPSSIQTAIANFPSNINVGHIIN